MTRARRGRLLLGLAAAGLALLVGPLLVETRAAHAHAAETADRGRARSERAALLPARVAGPTVAAEPTPARLALAPQPEPVLRGRLVDQDGRPIPDRRLLARASVVTRDAPDLERFGLPARTDALGRFHITASPDASYELLARERVESTRPGMTVVGPGPLVADGTWHELVLPRLPLRVRFSEPDLLLDWLDEPGDEVVAAPYTIGALAQYPVWPTLLLERVGVADEHRVHTGILQEDGSLLFHLPPSTGYRAILLGGDVVPVVGTVTVPAAGGAELLLPVERSPATGTLVVEPHAPAGRAVANAWVTVLLEGTRLPLIHDLVDAREAYDLPPGVYEVRVEDGTFDPGSHYPWAARPELGGIERVVEVRRGRTTDVHAQLPLGAKLRLRLTGRDEGEASSLVCRVRRVDRKRPVHAPFAADGPFLHGHWYESCGLPAGRYVVELGHWSGQGLRVVTSGRVSLSVGHVTDLELTPWNGAASAVPTSRARAGTPRRPARR